MIKLMDLLVENNNALSSKQWKLVTDVLYVMYDDIVRVEHDKDYRGEYIRVVFSNYSEALSFYNKGVDVLSKIVNIQRTQSGGPKNWLGGSMFVVSYKVIVD